ncbi:unnamed protein product [Rhizophagus irregularis]|nr:unnamed protein product [Rhizophagus irregularis]
MFIPHNGTVMASVTPTVNTILPPFLLLDDILQNYLVIEVDKNETLEEAHKRYNNKSITISFEINGRIDMRKSGSTYAATVHHYALLKGRLLVKDYLKKSI